MMLWIVGINVALVVVAILANNFKYWHWVTLGFAMPISFFDLAVLYFNFHHPLNALFALLGIAVAMILIINAVLAIPSGGDKELSLGDELNKLTM